MTCPRCGTETDSWPCPECGFPVFRRRSRRCRTFYNILAPEKAKRRADLRAGRPIQRSVLKRKPIVSY